eukprot:CAMPEP_0198258236 /NCGR_PEP_ID=MMETSP1447-20131203/7720_1 /TAXON_ID=420782 /ORGANISM="Chaetoceros dichaeta, Strain CCMP1751" /LENGTH=72 /DNA_ID=CAMNT_0043945317 /DNA_START=728 /DNA_END=946 /DNA_ORIENTATION=+
MNAIHSVDGPNRLRQDDSAAYCDDRSPGSSFAGRLLLQVLHDHSTRVTRSAENLSVTSAKVTFVLDAELSYT